MKKDGIFEEFEDRIRLKKDESKHKKNIYSRYCDFIYYESSVTPGITLAMQVFKPESPSYILASTHGWHMSIGAFKERSEAYSKYLQVSVDMRGRAHSEGKQDCNALELFDIIDAIEYVKKNYAEYIIDPEVVYFQGGSGGGGNALALAVKFPDYFAEINALSSISDYALWYKGDNVGEFRDEMDVWIGTYDNLEAYASRSAISAPENISCPIFLAHGELDIRVPVYQPRNFIEAVNKVGKGHFLSYFELSGVGGMQHFSGITDEKKKTLNELCEAAREKNRHPSKIARRGKMTVCGYLYTKHFSVTLSSVDLVRHIEYDLDKGYFNLPDAKENEYTLRVK